MSEYVVPRKLFSDPLASYYVSQLEAMLEAIRKSKLGFADGGFTGGGLYPDPSRPGPSRPGPSRQRGKENRNE